MKERIVDVIKRTFEITEVSDDISQKNCAKWDSMNHLNLILELESEFNISIEPEEITELRNFDDIINILTLKGVI